MKLLLIDEHLFMMNGKPEDYDPTMRSPFTAMIAGPTGSGKTQAIFRMIEASQTIAHPPPTEIHYCYGAYQKAFDDVSGVIFHEGMIDITVSFPRDGKNRWLIIDDLMDEVSGKADANALYTKHSHHLNISVFFIVQNLFLKGNRTISLNSHYFFLFKNPRDASSISYLARQCFPSKVKYVQEAFEDATKKPYSYLRIDTTQQTNDQHRLLGNFTSVLPMILYVPK